MPVINCTKEKSSFHNTVNLLLRFSEYLIYAFTDEFQICDSLQIDFIFVQYIFFSCSVKTRGGKSENYPRCIKKFRNYIGSKESALLQVVRMFLSNV